MLGMQYLKNVVTLTISQDRCTGCGICLTVCPHEVLDLSNGAVYAVNRDSCIECGACMVNCPAEAIHVQAGVGCASAVINSVLGRKSNNCCCVVEPIPAKQEEACNGAAPCHCQNE